MLIATLQRDRNVLTVAVLMAIVFTFGFSSEPSPVGKIIASIGEARTLGYKAHGAAGMLTLFVRGVLCNWMVSSGVVGAMVATTVGGKVLAMWLPITLFFGMTFEHSVVNMFLASSALHMALSVIGVFIFVGLTAYDTQKLKSMYYQIGAAGEMAQKMAIMGALNLYMDFINLFIMLLRFFGDRR